MRRRRAGLVAVLLVAVVLTPTPARAAEPAVTTVGWWSRSPGQQAPAGGFAVAVAPDGPVTVAAVEILVGEAEVLRATLSAVEVGGVAQDAAALQACLTTSAWQPEEGGAWDDAPEPACDEGSVALTRDADARTWSAELTSLLAGATGSVSVMIVPGDEVQGSPPAPPAPGLPAPPAPSSPSPAFDVRLAAPTLDADAVELGDRSGAGDGPVITGNDDPGPSGSTSPELSYAPPPIVAPTTAAATTDAVDAGTPQEPVADAAPAGESEQRALQPLRSTGDSESRPWGKALLYVLVASVIGTGAGLGRWVLREKLA